MHQIFFTLLLILLPTQLGIHFWPEWALVLGRRVDYLSPTLYLTDILLFLTILFWSISVKFRIIHNGKIIILFLFFAAVNIFFTESPMAALYKWAKVFEFGLLGVYIITTKQTIKNIIFPLTIGVLYSSVIAIAQFILQRSIGGPLWLLGERTFSNQTPGIAQFYVHQLWLRAYGTFPHPNVLGGYLAALLPLIIYHITKFTKWKKTFFVTAIVLGYIALLLTCSRGAWAAGILGLCMLYYVVWRKKNYWPLAIAVCTVLAIICSFGLQDESVVVRSQLNNSALAMFFQSPLVGVGLGNYLVQLPDFLVSRQIYFLQPVHNIYLLVLTETGLIGFYFFLFVVWSALKNRFRSIHYSLCIMLLLGLIDHYPLTLQQGQLLFTLLLAMCVIQLPHADTR